MRGREGRAPSRPDSCRDVLRHVRPTAHVGPNRGHDGAWPSMRERGAASVAWSDALRRVRAPPTRWAAITARAADVQRAVTISSHIPT